MSADDIKNIISVATLSLAVGTVVWNGGKLAKAHELLTGLFEKLSAIVKQHDERISVLERTQRRRAALKRKRK